MSSLAGGIRINHPRTSSLSGTRTVFISALIFWLLHPGNSDNTFPFIVLTSGLILSFSLCFMRDRTTWNLKRTKYFDNYGPQFCDSFHLFTRDMLVRGGGSKGGKSEQSFGQRKSYYQTISRLQLPLEKEKAIRQTPGYQERHEMQPPPNQKPRLPRAAPLRVGNQNPIL